jgi:hypothetical protein
MSGWKARKMVSFTRMMGIRAMFFSMRVINLVRVSGWGLMQDILAGI